MTETIEQRALRWASGNQVGVSSKAILQVMTGNPPGDGYCYPHDGDDLQRCLVLLALIPEWKPRLAEMKTVGPEWAALVDHWDELHALYLKGYAPTTKRMKEILDPIEAKRPGLIRLNENASVYFHPRKAAK